MVSKSKKILITTQRHEVFIIRQNGDKAIFGLCPECGLEVELLNLDTAVSLAQKRTHELLALIEGGAVHSIETTTGHLLICKRSMEIGKIPPRGGMLGR